MKQGELRRSETEAMVQTLLEKGRETATHLAEAVQAEVTKQLGWLANRVDDVEDQLETLVSRLSPGGSAPASAPAVVADPVPTTAASATTTSTAAPRKHKAPARAEERRPRRRR